MQYSSILFLTLRFIKTRLYLHYFRPHFLSLSLSLITHSILSQSTVSNLDFLRPPVEKAKYLSRIFQPIKPITTDVVKQNFPFLNWPDNIIFVIQPNTFLLLILFLSKFLFLFTSSEYPLSRKSKSLFSYYSYLIQTPIRFNANFSTFHQILQIRFLPALNPKIRIHFPTQLTNSILYPSHPRRIPISPPSPNLFSLAVLCKDTEQFRFVGVDEISEGRGDGGENGAKGGMEGEEWKWKERRRFESSTSSPRTRHVYRPANRPLCRA